ncbi:hypothetical protein NUACC21_06370 [Scytonema sp. NUACC21]
MMFARQWKTAVIGVIIFCFISFVHTSELANGVESSVTLSPQWKTNEKIYYQMVKTRLRSQEGKVMLNITARNNLEIEVIEANDKSYVLKFLYGDVTIDDSKQAKENLFQQMIDNLNQLQTPIILKVDSFGAVEGVQNWEQIKEAGTASVDKIIKQLQNIGIDEATVVKTRAQMISTFATKEQFEKTSTGNLKLFFVPLGKTYELSEPIEYEDKLPNPLGGEPYPSRGQLTLKTLDKKLNRAVVIWKQTILPEPAKRILERTLKDLSVRLGNQVPKESLPHNVTIEDTAEFSVDISSGWIDNFTYTRTINIGKSFQKETISINKNA